MATAHESDRPEDGPEPPEPSPRVSLLFEDGSTDEDFAWIAARFRDLTGATDIILSLHPAGGGPELLMMQGPVRRDPVACGEVLALAAQASAPVRRRSDAGPRLGWERLGGKNAEPVPVLVLMLAGDGQSQVVLTALFRNGDGDGEAESAALRIYPVLVGYFRLWLVARAQRRRLDGFASALNSIDTAVCLLDAQARLLFANKTALALLDAGEGLMRTGAGLTASEMADAVKLRVAIDHFIAAGHGGGAGAAIVNLNRSSGLRPLIVAVVPADTPPRYVEDPTLVLLAFDPEQDISELLAPVCHSYGLSPAESRLVSFLMEGLTVGDAALRMRVKVPTLRTYLKQIFGKTGTCRQSDLIRLLMGSIVRTRKGLAFQLI